MKALYELFIDILSGSASEEEKLLFREQIKLPENQILFEKLKVIWEESSNLKGYHRVDMERAFAELSKKLTQKKRDRKKYAITIGVSIAASVLFMLGLFNFIQSGSDPFGREIIVQTELGNRTVVYLPDSTKVWVNSLSQVSYSSDFGKESRYVHLSGEAFFEVTHSKVPFIVDVDQFRIKVYGTKFNVSAYSDDPQFSTSLEQGSIGISQENGKELKLIPGQMAVYSKNTSQFKLSEVNVKEYSSWTNNKMYMHGEPLSNLARKLERKFKVEIDFSPADISSQIHYSGVFDVENVEEILDAISLASDLNYKKKGNQYQIRRN